MKAAIKENAFHVDFVPDMLASDHKNGWNLTQYQSDRGQKIVLISSSWMETTNS